MRNSADGIKGVRKRRDGGWVCQIGGKYIGYYTNFDDAADARIAAEKEAYGAELHRESINVVGECANIPLHGRGNVFYGWATIDVSDLELVKRTAWTMDARGYAFGRPKGTTAPITMHRWIMGMGAPHANRKCVIDHVNRNKLDNRRINLRICSQSENSRNSILSKNNSTGAKGVGKTFSGKYRARIWFDRKEIHIGTFNSMEEAADAYDAMSATLHGAFASPNKLEAS